MNDDLHHRRSVQLIRRLEATADAARRLASECDQTALALAELIKGLPEHPSKEECSK